MGVIFNPELTEVELVTCATVINWQNKQLIMRNLSKIRNIRAKQMTIAAESCKLCIAALGYQAAVAIKPQWNWELTATMKSPN